MEFETSSAIIISAPLRLFSLSLAPICGLASPIAKKNHATAKNEILTHPFALERSGISAANMPGLPSLAIFLFLPLRKSAYPMKKKGISSISSKYCACAKCIISLPSLIRYLFCYKKSEQQFKHKGCQCRQRKIHEQLLVNWETVYKCPALLHLVYLTVYLKQF